MQRHSFDIISAGFGAIFVWFGVAALVPDVSIPVETIWPMLAVFLGVAVLLSAIRSDVDEEESVVEEEA